jgi:hypothetical protein
VDKAVEKLLAQGLTNAFAAPFPAGFSRIFFDAENVLNAF